MHLLMQENWADILKALSLNSGLSVVKKIVVNMHDDALDDQAN